MSNLIQLFNSYTIGIFGVFTELTGIVLGLSMVFIYRNLFKKIIFASPENAASGRNNLADMMKGVAIHGVVIIHIDSYFRYFHQNDLPVFFTLLLANLSRFAVPWFIITSGMFLHWRSVESYWSSKIRNLVIPFVMVCIVAYPVKFRLTEDWWVDFIIRTVNGSVFTPYYFVPLLVEFYILYALIFKNLDRGKIGFYLIISFLVNLASNHYLEQMTGHGAFAASFFTNYIFYFIFGMAINKSFRDPVALGRLIAQAPGFKMMLFAALLVYAAVVGHGTWHFQFEASNHYIFYPVALFILVYALFGSRDSGYLAYTGKNSLGIFLLHPFVIHMMHSFDPYSLGGAVGGWVLAFFLNIAIPLLVWKAAEYLIGVLVPVKSG